MRSESLAEAQKRYAKKLIQFNIKYQIHEAEEGRALQEYLEATNQTANNYIKGLVKSDLKSKGYIKEDNNERDESRTTI